MSTLMSVKLYALLHALAAGQMPIVPTINGPVQGFDREVHGQVVSSFQGIPFAEPPVGHLRFRYPEPLNRSWTDPLNASVPAAACAQKKSDQSSEDCLYLNVYTPRKALASNAPLLPVMFWIFGGGFMIGDGWFHGIYDGIHFAGHHDVVVVAGNYRLAALGFSTFADGPHGERGTAAMADQRLALAWSWNNIKAFGGNSSRTTIFGESAGAMSVVYHLVSPPSWPLFSAAIVESGNSFLSWFFQPLAEAETLYAGWAKGVGCPSNTEQLQCLQALPESAFLTPPYANYTGRSPIYGSFASGPVVDGTRHGLLATPLDLIKAGKFAKVPLIIGANKEDASLFEPDILEAIPGARLEALTQEDADIVLNWLFDPVDAERIAETYPVSEFRFKSINPHQKQIEQVMRDVAFHCSNREVATQWAKSGLDVFVYSFAFDFGPLLNKLPVGDFHGSEIPFVFNNLLNIVKMFPLRGNVDKMADIVSCLWASFAYTGSPNGDVEAAPNCERVRREIDTWPAFGKERAFYSLNEALFGKPRSVLLQADNMYPNDEYPSDRRCDMWSSVQFPWRDRVNSLATVV